MSDIKFIDRLVHDDNDSEQDEYELRINVMSDLFWKLVTKYNNSSYEDILGNQYEKPFDMNNEQHQLAFVCWLSSQLQRL